jgi:hypothetical protein
MNQLPTRTYLDTSVLRGLGRRATKVLDQGCCTSALALLELLAGVRKDDKSYARRRAAILAVLDATPKSVIWELPDSRLTTCFALVRKTCTTIEQRIEPLRKLLDCVRLSPDRTAFAVCAEGLNLPFSIEFFEKLDGEFGVEFRKSTEKGNAEIREAFNRAPAGGSIIPANIRTASFNEFCIWFRDQAALLNFSITVSGLARRVVEQVPSLPEGAVHDSYDGSIDVFVNALSFVSMAMTANMDLPGRNDALDLAHFLFLEKGDTLATDDNKARAVAEAAGVRVIGSGNLECGSGGAG